MTSERGVDANYENWKPLALSLLKERVEFRVLNATESVVRDLIKLSVIQLFADERGSRPRGISAAAKALLTTDA